MHQRHSARVLTAIALAASTVLGACSESSLAVTNPNNPDVEKAYGTPANVETIISKLYQQMFNGMYNSSDDIWTQSLSMSFESHSQLGNFGMGTRAAIPRSPIDNSIGNSVASGNFQDFDALSRNARSAANAIAALNAFIEKGLSTGAAARDARASAFAWFTSAFAHGQLSLVYDSAVVIKPGMSGDEIPAFSAAKDVNAFALQALDSAIAQAGKATGQSIPVEWISGNAAMPMSDFVRLMRSFKARYRAGVARSATERAAVDWNAVIADATNGITSDWVVSANATTGWGVGVLTQLRVSSGWSQMTPMILGMADTSGAYKAWIATPLMQRTPFLLRTPDKRFPSGETRAAQNTASGGSSKGGPPAGSILYFRNRPSGDDTPAEPWGTWFYDNHRFWAIGAGGGNGPFIPFTVAENDMLAAEGYLRTQQIAKATPLIDKYRTRAGLPSVAGITDLTTPVPGGSACVPQVPVGPSFTTTACGNLMEAMKWEKRVETSFTGYAQWFVDARGWGDLVRGTAVEWPVPYQELFARQLASYTTTKSAPVGTYGF
jgi:hypothetical protein